uniref:Putative secreted protein n=1 Tax=Anopheles darlingi TaxID=43151 RepID=A0A2M4DI29_ANODA
MNSLSLSMFFCFVCCDFAFFSLVFEIVNTLRYRFGDIRYISYTRLLIQRAVCIFTEMLARSTTPQCFFFSNCRDTLQQALSVFRTG